MIFFFYGTLMRGEAGYHALRLDRRARFVAADAIAGTLHDLGGYPGALPGEGTILGELFEIADPALIAELDRFEDCDAADPEGSEYRRIAVETHGGRRAWTYFHRRIAAGTPAIAGGDWRQVAAGQA